MRFVTVARDVRLKALDWGGRGDALIYLAGANFNAHAFDDFTPRFRDSSRVIDVTRSGHGAESPSPGYASLRAPARITVHWTCLWFGQVIP